MLRSSLRRLRQFMAADLMAELDRMGPELRAARAENAALRDEVACLRGDLAGLRHEMAERGARETALARQMEAALLAIALSHREPAG